MKKRIISILLSLLLVVGLFTGCSGNNDSNTPSGNNGNNDIAKDSIIIGQNGDVTTLDAQMFSDLTTESVCLNIYEPVVRVTNDGEITEGVAEKWEISDDGMQYIFYIREGMKFHNGEEVKPSDVKFTLERCMESPYVQTYFSYIDTVEAIDNTVVVNLKYPYSPFLAIMGSYAGVVSEASLKDDENALSRNPIGSGPYKFVEWSQGDKIVLEANEDYYKGVAPIKNVTFKVIGDLSTATISLEKGEVDAFINISPTDIVTVENHDNLAIEQVSSYIFRFLGINCEKEPFNDVKVRQAISYALDKEGIVIGAEEGVGAVAQSHIPVGIAGYNESFKGHERNIEKAKQLLAEAGYPNGFKTEMVATENRSMHAQIIQANLKEIGIDVDIKLYESGTFYELLENGEFELQILGWSYICPDPDVAIYDLYKSGGNMAGNYGRYNNPKMDELLEAGRKSVNQDEKQKIYEEIEELAKEDAFNIPLYWTMSNIAYNKALKGVEASPKLSYFVYNFSW